MWKPRRAPSARAPPQAPRVWPPPCSRITGAPVGGPATSAVISTSPLANRRTWTEGLTAFMRQAVAWVPLGDGSATRLRGAQDHTRVRAGFGERLEMSITRRGLAFAAAAAPLLGPDLARAATAAGRAKTEYGDFGIDLSAIDKSIAPPGDDFYRYPTTAG
jgi:hypothetical protein